MKVAIFSESEADDAALRIIAEAVLRQPIEPVTHAGLRHRGWPSVRGVLRSVLLELHFHTDAEGFLLVVDSNGTPPHQPAHDASNPGDLKCRLCQLQKIRKEVLGRARPREGRASLKTAFGLAIPSIEAWLRCDQDAHVNEASWYNGFASGCWPYTVGQLKKDLYGTDHPSLAIEKERMIEAASRLAKDLAGLEKSFPNGFGAFVTELRAWV